MVCGNLNAFEIESLMDEEIETHHHEGEAPAHALHKVGDAMPAFGIVAAVMGVVHTMGSVDQPPAVLGEMIAQALVGTFLGILLSYGLIGPLASLAEQRVDESTKMFQCIKMTMLASLNGYAPAIAVEFGRKVLFSTERPSFAELEEHVRRVKASNAPRPRDPRHRMSNDKDRADLHQARSAKKGGHHGGAWKIAYADFMTAMMAFFLLMWLLSSASHRAAEGHRRLLQPCRSRSRCWAASQRRWTRAS